MTSPTITTSRTEERGKVFLGQIVAQGTKLGEIKSLERLSGENQPAIDRRSLRFAEAAIMRSNIY